MNSANFESALRGFCRRKPFLAFWVELVTGGEIHVLHPEAVALRGAVAVFIRRDGGYQVFDGEGVCQLFDESREELAGLD